MSKKICLIVIFVFLISGCASVVRHAVPEGLINNAQISGMPDIRALGGSPNYSFKKDFAELLEKAQKNGSFLSRFNTVQVYSVLAISGGAAYGAYGAGLLNGWSESGTRPVFKVVTGISTGAIIAPFAFLGRRYDQRLKEFYTQHSTKDVMRIRFPRFKIPFSNSVATTWPLEQLIEKYFDADLLKEIAIEYNKGRRIYVGTTNLDAERLVIWDMGKIASIGDEKALRLFRKIILASAAVPVAFPPVYFKSVVNDKEYDEMHVDGGMSKQVFFIYDVLQGFDRALKEKGVDSSRKKYAIYVIKNGYADPIYKEIPDNLFAIAERALDSMTNAQSLGDLYQLYTFAERQKGGFYLASVPVTYVSQSKEAFDPVEMCRLFDLGFKQAVRGYPWRKAPPGIQEE